MSPDAVPLPRIQAHAPSPHRALTVGVRSCPAPGDEGPALPLRKPPNPTRPPRGCRLLQRRRGPGGAAGSAEARHRRTPPSSACRSAWQPQARGRSRGRGRGGAGRVGCGGAQGSVPPAGAGGGPGPPERGERSAGVPGSHRMTGSQGTDSCLTCEAQIRYLQNIQPRSALVRKAAVPYCARHPSRGSRGPGLGGAAPSLGKAHILSSLPACKPPYAELSGRFAAQRAVPRPCLTTPHPAGDGGNPARHRGRRPETLHSGIRATGPPSSASSSQAQMSSLTPDLGPCISCHQCSGSFVFLKETTGQRKTVVLCQHVNDVDSPRPELKTVPLPPTSLMLKHCWASSRRTITSR